MNESPWYCNLEEVLELAHYLNENQRFYMIGDVLCFGYCLARGFVAFKSEGIFVTGDVQADD